MFKKNGNFFNEIEGIMSGNLKKYITNFFTLTAAFVMLYLASVIAFNSFKYTESLKKSFYMSVYLEGDSEEKSVLEFEKKLLGMPEVKSLKFESKQLSLRELENELGIRLPKGDNPLSDSMLVIFDSYDNLEPLQKSLEKEGMVKEVYADKEQLKNLEGRILKNKLLFRYFVSIAFTSLIIIILNLYHANITRDIRDIRIKIYLGEKRRAVLKPYYFMSDWVLIGASVTGGLVILNIYEFFRREFITYDNNYFLANTEELALYVGALSLISIVIFPIVSRTIHKVSGD